MRLGRTARVLKDGAMALCSPALSKMAGPAAIAPEVLGFVDVQQLQETWPWQVHVGRRLHVRGIGLDCCRLSQVCLGMLRQIPGRYVWADGRQYNGEWVENQMPAAHI